MRGFYLQYDYAAFCDFCKEQNETVESVTIAADRARIKAANLEKECPVGMSEECRKTEISVQKTYLTHADRWLAEHSKK